MCKHFPSLSLPPSPLLWSPISELAAFGHCFYARGHLSPWVNTVFLCRVLLQPVLKQCCGYRMDHELQQRAGKLGGHSCRLASFVEVLVGLSTKEFEVNLPPLPAHSFHFPFSKNDPLRENRRRCSAFGLLSQQLVSYSGSCKLQFFSPVKPTHTAIHFYLSLMWRLWRNNS